MILGIVIDGHLSLGNDLEQSEISSRSLTEIFVTSGKLDRLTARNNQERNWSNSNTHTHW